MSTKENPLISVIIPCYNHGLYISKAIESVLTQTYEFYEIIVVDDGSEDHTKKIADRFPQVKYIYQNNSGLSAARNTGIDHSAGDFIIFLDADDWLLPAALKTNLDLIIQEPALAFISGGYQLYYEKKNELQDVIKEVKDNHYCHLLEGNYVGMIATAMFQKWVFDLFRYDTSLKFCEDYDLYLRIARKFKTLQHTTLIAVYRIHKKNMSGNALLMLESALLVLNRQKNNLQNKEEEHWFQKGQVFWKWYYTAEMFDHLICHLNDHTQVNKPYLTALKQYNKIFYLKFMYKKYAAYIYKFFKNKKASFRTLPGQVNLGDFNQTIPFSEEFGYDRGGPVDRYYIEKFLENNASSITGRVLEIGDNEYSLKYGGSKIAQSDILHIDDSNPKATFTGDLSNAPHLPGNSFDTIILTQTLHLIYNYKSAIETCYRILKPGGTLLITVPGISHIGDDQWGKYWLWSFTDNSISKILYEYFSPQGIKVKTFGNVLVATAFLYGMGLPELNMQQMNAYDSRYQLIIAATAVK